jgi:hypothetical protein
MNNSVESLVINGNMMADSRVIKEHIVKFYEHLYFEQYMWRPKVDGFSFLSIDEGQRGTEWVRLWNGRQNWMEKDFEERSVVGGEQFQWR